MKKFYVNVFSYIWNMNIFFELVDKDMVMLGEDAKVNFKMQKKMGLKEGQRFIIRGGGNDGSVIVGYGVVIKIMDEVNFDDMQVEFILVKKVKKKFEKVNS